MASGVMEGGIVHHYRCLHMSNGGLYSMSRSRSTFDSECLHTGLARVGAVAWALRGLYDSSSEFQYANVSGVAVLDNGLVPRSEY
jgi:hypothetical protein